MRSAYQPYKNINILNLGNICRPDKAFTPHPAGTKPTLVTEHNVLEGLMTYFHDYFFNLVTLSPSLPRSFIKQIHRHKIYKKALAF